MARCGHGFEPTSVKCPFGCHGELSKHKGRERTYSDDDLRAALTNATSIRQACARLGVKQTSVYVRSRAKADLWALYEKAKAVSGPEGNSHPGLRDLTGQRFGVLEVVRRAQNRGNGNAAWVCRCHGCGAEEIYEGIQLRSRRTPARWCRSCRAANPGTVTRRAG